MENQPFISVEKELISCFDTELTIRSVFPYLLIHANAQNITMVTSYYLNQLFWKIILIAKHTLCLKMIDSCDLRRDILELINVEIREDATGQKDK